jgi:ribosomal protein S17
MVHDELNIGKCGDLVLVEEIPPKSKQKKWQIKKILKVYQDQKQEI